MNLFSLIIAIGPIGLYWILIGVLHLRRRPLILSGSRDLACLGLSMVGLFLIGPAELFFPNAAFNRLGIFVWLFIFMLYGSLLLFVILNSKPRLVVFGFRDQELVPHVVSALEKIDPTTRWLGQHFVSPGLQIEAVIEQAGFGRIAHVVTTRRDQNVSGWSQLERALREEVGHVSITPRAHGKFWLPLGILIIGCILYTLAKNPSEVAQGFKEMLRL